MPTGSDGRLKIDSRDTRVYIPGVKRQRFGVAGIVPDDLSGVGGTVDLNVSVRESSALLQEERRVLRTKLIVMSVCLVVLFVLSLGVSVDNYAYYSPGETFSCLALRIQVFFHDVFTTQSSYSFEYLTSLESHYFQVLARFNISLVTIVCGAFLALAGSLYQIVFRNPIAAPTMLGINNGINLGVIVLILVFGEAALYMTTYRYIFCYAGAIGILAIVLIAGRATNGKGELNVVNMLLIASIISQLLGAIVMFLTSYVIPAELYTAYYGASEQLDVIVEPITVISMAVILAVGIIPIFLMRFSLNAMSFSSADARYFGVNGTFMRFVSLTCGSLMVIAAQIFSGMVAMISLVVPHLSRALFGAEFKKQFFGNMLIGSLLLLICRDIAALVPFFDNGLPVGFVVSIITLPAFVWMLALQQRNWT
jgi:iron complex transport system permease protein